MVLEQLDIYAKKKKKKIDTDTFHRILVQMDQRPKYKIRII